VHHVPAILVLLMVVAVPGQVGADEWDDGAAEGVDAWLTGSMTSGADLGAPVAIAVDPNTGRRFVAYHDVTNNDLWLVYDVGSGGNCGPNNRFSCRLVESDADPRDYVDMAVHSDNASIHVHLAYHSSANVSLEYTHARILSAGLFLKETQTIHQNAIFYDVGRHVSLALDADNRPHIAYQTHDFLGSNDGLHLASYVGNDSGNCYTGSDFDCSVITSGDGVGMYASLAFNSNDLPRVAYYDPVSGAPKIALSDGSTWSFTTVGQPGKDCGQHVSIWVDDANTVHIAYLNETDESIEYAYPSITGNCGSGFWQCDVIEDVGYQPGSLKLIGDPNGYPMLAYFDRGGTPAVKTAQPAAATGDLTGNCGPGVIPFLTWKCSVVDESNLVFFLGNSLDLAMDDMAGASIAYTSSVVGNVSIVGAGQNDAPIFRDRFESGNTTWWNAVTQ
jgi:hypothetical protein